MADRETEREPLMTLDQQRAAKAWAQVSEGVPTGKGGDYRTVVRQSPAMIQINGLGQTLAFLLAKEKCSAQAIQRQKSGNQLGAHGLLYKHLEEWLIGSEGAASTVDNEQVRRLQAPIPWTQRDKNTVIERIIAEDSTIYRQATYEALAYLSWLKRFAEARFGEKGSQHS